MASTYTDLIDEETAKLLATEPIEMKRLLRQYCSHLSRFPSRAREASVIEDTPTPYSVRYRSAAVQSPLHVDWGLYENGAVSSPRRRIDSFSEQMRPQTSSYYASGREKRMTPPKTRDQSFSRAHAIPYSAPPRAPKPRLQNIGEKKISFGSEIPKACPTDFLHSDHERRYHSPIKGVSVSPSKLSLHKKLTLSSSPLNNKRNGEASTTTGVVADRGRRDRFIGAEIGSEFDSDGPNHHQQQQQQQQEHLWCSSMPSRPSRQRNFERVGSPQLLESKRPPIWATPNRRAQEPHSSRSPQYKPWPSERPAQSAGKFSNDDVKPRTPWYIHRQYGDHSHSTSKILPSRMKRVGKKKAKSPYQSKSRKGRIDNGVWVGSKFAHSHHKVAKQRAKNAFELPDVDTEALLDNLRNAKISSRNKVYWTTPENMTNFKY